MRFRYWLWPCLIVPLFFYRTPLLAQPSFQQEQLELLLSDYERAPHKEELLRFGPQVEQLLRNIVRQPSPRAFARLRAISLLQYFPSRSTAETLKKIIKQKRGASLSGISLLELKSALPAYATVVGPTSLEVVQSFLNHPSLEVRSSAIQAIALTQNPLAHNLLVRRQAVERTPWLRRELELNVKKLRYSKTAR